MKIKDEESIISAMQHITDRLPDFKVYEKIYPDPLLRSMLVDAYTDIILLAREATSYFYGSSFSKWKTQNFELFILLHIAYEAKRPSCPEYGQSSGV